MNFDPVLALTCPGIVGVLARAITAQAIKPQPVLSVCSALATIATIKCHRIKAPTGLRTNLFIAGVAGSGRGKNHPLEYPKLVLQRSGMDLLVGGEPASGGGLLRSVADGNGRRLILWDEFGIDLNKISGKGSANFQNEILGTMMKLFSCANSSVSGKELTNSDGQTKTLFISQPSLNIFAVSTPDHLWNALSYDHAVDGFIARWLFAQTDDSVNPEPNHTAQVSIPLQVLDYIQEVQTWTGYLSDEQGNLAFLHPKPLEATYTPEALNELKLVSESFEDMSKDCKTEGGVELHSLWARGSEHVTKVAMTIAQSPEIHRTEIDWAYQFVLSSIALIQNVLMERVGNNELERKAKKILKLIQVAGKIYHRDLVRLTQYMDRSERNKILDILIEGERIEQIEFHEGDKKSYVYTIL